MNLAVSVSIQLLGFSDRKHALHFGDPEQFLNTRAHARDAQPNSFALTPDIMEDQHAEAVRIHVWDLSQIKNVYGGLLVARHRFQDVAEGVRRHGGIHVPRGKWPGESKDGALLFSCGAFDCEPGTLPYLGFD